MRHSLEFIPPGFTLAGYERGHGIFSRLTVITSTSYTKCIILPVFASQVIHFPVGKVDIHDHRYDDRRLCIGSIASLVKIKNIKIVTSHGISSVASNNL